MSVAQTELIKMKSLTGDSAGGAMSATPISETPQNNLYPNVSDGDRVAGITRYRKWFLFNNSASDPLIRPSVWVDSMPVDSDQKIGVGFDSVDDADAAQGNMTEWTTNAVVSLRSSAADTRVATVVGLDGTGTPAHEDVTLTGTSEKLSTTIFSVVYAVMMATTAALTVTVKEGAGGTTRGTIGSSKKCCWVWLVPLNKGEGIHRESLPAQEGYGYWESQTVPPGVSGLQADGDTLGIEED